MTEQPCCEFTTLTLYAFITNQTHQLIINHSAVSPGAAFKQKL